MGVKLNKILKKGKALFLSYDQGLEHGPTSDFNDKNVDPLYILKIAKKGKYNGVVFQKGVAEKYNKEIRKSKVPLILKLNGKTKIYRGEPISSEIATVKEAVKLGTSAVGFTIYIGSEHETKMIEEFEKVEREAHAKGLPVIAWIYPRGKSVKNDVSREMISYAARTGLELGADIVKLKYGGNPKDLSWAVKSAGRTKVVVAGGTKKGEKEFLKQLKENKVKNYFLEKWNDFCDWFTDKEHPRSRLNRTVFLYDLLKLIGLILIFLILYSNTDKLNEIVLLFIKIGSLLQLVLLFLFLSFYPKNPLRASPKVP